MNGRVHLLGGFGVLRGGTEVDDLKSRPTCAALLAVVAAEGRVTRDEAALLLWPESDTKRARHALNQTVYQLRKTLGADWILSHGQELRLGPGIDVDTAMAQAALEAGDFAEALELSAGRFLEGWHLRDTATFEEWTRRKDLRHRTLFRDAARRGIARAEAEEDLRGLLAIARRWAEVEPSLEEASLHLIRAHLELGEPRSALDAHDAYARNLADLGSVPGPEVVSLAATARAGLGGEWKRPVDPGPSKPVHRLLVLPFAHSGPAELGHLTAGLTDEITATLSRDEEIAVIARPSALRIDRTGKTLVEIGRELDVDSVVDGRVRWPAGGGRGPARASVRHVRVVDGAQLWAEELETSVDGFESIGSDLVGRTRRAIGLRVPADEETYRPVERQRSPAYELCVRGLQHWHRRSQGELREAIDLFIRAIEADPRYAHAYGCLGLAYAMMPSFAGLSPLEWMPRARRTAEVALELDPHLVEGHLAMGLVAWTFDLDPDAAGRHWQRVREREASNVQLLVWEAYRFVALGDPPRGRRCIREAETLDPLSVSVNFDAGLVRWLLREEEQAQDRMRRVLAMDPSFTPAAFFLGAAHLRRGDVEEARRAWTRIRALGPAWATVVAELPDRRRARVAVDRLVSFSPQPVHWYATAVVYTLLGEPDRALDWLEAHFRALHGERVALPTGGPGLFIMVRDPFFDPLRSTPRFRTLLRALGVGPGG